MSITSEIQRIQGNISDAYNSCAAKGATMPATQNSAYLADTINSITGGGGGTEGYDLGVGKYWVDNGVAKQPQAGDVSNSFQMITSIINNGMRNACQEMNIIGTVNFANCVNIGYNGLNRAFYNCKQIEYCNFNKLETVEKTSFYSAFYNCSGLQSASFPNLQYANSSAFQTAFAYSGIKSIEFTGITNINGDYSNFQSVFSQVCYYCNNCESVNFCNLVNATGRNIFSMAFQGCISLQSVNFDSLSNLGQSSLSLTFSYCQSLRNISFYNLSTLGVQAMSRCFENCTNLNIYLPALVASNISSSAFNNMLRYGHDCTVHFPAAVESTINTWSDVTSGFNGTNTTVLFDL